MSTITISFAVRESKARTSGEAPIQVLLTQNGVRASFSTGKAVHPSEWDRNRQRVRSKEPEAIEINSYLDAIRARLYYLEKVLIDRDIGVSPQLLRDAYLGRLECLKEWTLMKVVEVHLEDLRAKIGESIAASTVWEYELCGRLIERYIKHRYSRNDMSIKEVKIGFISGFHAWLLKERKMKQNSATKHLKFLQKVMNIAVMNGYIPYNTLSMYKVVREPVNMEYLNEAELQKIIDFESPLEHLVRTRDMFLFGCFTGLSYIDIKTLSREHFETDDEGRRWIKKRREKTGVLSRIPVLPIAQSILDKYSGGKVLLPMPDNADVNRYLKDIAVLCEIDKRVCFHTSRHTFATTVTLTNGVPIESVSKMLGHRSLKTTQVYAKIAHNKLAEDMSNLSNRLQYLTM